MQRGSVDPPRAGHLASSGTQYEFHCRFYILLVLHYTNLSLLYTILPHWYIFNIIITTNVIIIIVNTDYIINLLPLPLLLLLLVVVPSSSCCCYNCCYCFSQCYNNYSRTHLDVCDRILCSQRVASLSIRLYHSHTFNRVGEQWQRENCLALLNAISLASRIKLTFITDLTVYVHADFN